jgi:hypothetical protein
MNTTSLHIPRSSLFAIRSSRQWRWIRDIISAQRPRKPAMIWHSFSAHHAIALIDIESVVDDIAVEEEL